MTNILDDLKEAGPMSGGGFFDITKETFISMISISVTYIIILVQFRSTE